jgi:high-affinity iron transporter
LITFREAFEAILIVSIILVYLGRTGRVKFQRYIWIGIIFAITLSLIIGAIVWVLYKDLSDSTLKLFEGVAALIAVVVLTSMILWMAIKSGSIKEEIRTKVEGVVEKGTVIGFIGLAFVVVFREGLETVLFLTPFSSSDPVGTALGIVLGIISALVLSFLIFMTGKKIDIRKFFYFTSILLILLAAGLLGYAVHELIEYNEALGQDVGWLGSTAFDLGISKGNIFHHKNAVGSIFAVMFGYSVKMEWGRIIAHMVFLVTFLPLTLLIYINPEHVVIKKLKSLGGLLAGGKKERSIS